MVEKDSFLWKRGMWASSQTEPTGAMYVPSFFPRAGSLWLREYQGHGRQHIHTCTFGGKDHREEPVLQEGRLADCCILGFSAWTSWVFNFGVSVLMAISWVFSAGKFHRSWDDPKTGETLRIWALHRMLVPCQPVHLLVWPASRFTWPLRDLMMPWQPVPMLNEKKRWRTEEYEDVSVTSSVQIRTCSKTGDAEVSDSEKQIVGTDCKVSR